ncbi:thioesterase II family protein [Rugosimonospora africana]|uniref:Thioesterase domain-containing protein n=1 Tax=Rugosimonospora africana TaxID=556532 RepID=A0A8J3VUU2_9ACTN|nr:thioesterase [Rugosimonospora africana]GIH19615.1 hypothetical protein Raf01_77870 [Rugosimonospora africana]
MRGGEQGEWFVPVDRRATARVRLFVFPHAGAGPAAAAALRDLLPPEIEPWVVNLPGRHTRQAEPARTDIGPLSVELAEAIRDHDDLPHALFGYCGGALLAYLVAGHHTPQRLFVGSFAAPDVALIPRRMHLVPDPAFWNLVLEEGGIPPQLARHDELRAVFEPPLRADFTLYAGYRHRPAQPLATAITVLYGRDDQHLSRGSVLGWRRHSRQPLDLCELTTGHWLLDQAADQVAGAIAGRLTPGPPVPPLRRTPPP